MAAPAPSSLFTRLVTVWRDLSLRSDVDDIVLELLGRFSLEKIYAETGDGETYQRLVISLLAQLNAVFYIQRLTLPAENVHVGRYLGLLVSWEVTVRCIEVVLQVVNDGREALWDCRMLRDKYLAEFLLSALRILTLHPRSVTSQRSRRERYARIHKSLEQVFDSYPGDKSFLLLVSKEVTSQLCADPHAIRLPQRLRHELPNLTAELYPLEECLSSQYIADVVAQEAGAENNWLYQFLTLRDISHFVIGASIQYSANHETRDVRLQSSSARSRNAILRALENVRLPAHLTQAGLVSTFNSTFRIILPDTLDLASNGPSDDSGDADAEDLEFDALDAFGVKLSERQIVHRVSDGEMMHSISQVIREIVLQDNPSGHFGTSRPNLHVLDCSECHLVGGAELRAHDIQVPPNMEGRSCPLPHGTTCPICGGSVSLAREVTLARKTWENLRTVETDCETINVERHLPSQFQLQPPRPETDELYSPISPVSSTAFRSFPFEESRSQLQRHALVDDPRPIHPRPTLNPGRTTETSPSPRGSEPHPQSSPEPALLTPESPIIPRPTSDRGRLMSDASTYVDSTDRNIAQELSFVQTSPVPFSDRAKQSYEDILPRRRSEATVEKPKSKWRPRLPFTTAKQKPAGPAHTSGDSSSLSSGGAENQKLEEIPLGSLTSGSKSRGKAAKTVHAYLSQNSTLALFWSQFTIQIWDVGTSPPTMTRGFSTDSTCILAAVAKTHAAYIIGTRDQKLTLRIVNLTQPSNSSVEYRMPSSPWCRSIAIDRNENYVAVGFDESTVRFFKTAGAEQPREDRLHSLLHDDCRRCPSVDTLSFSHDGLALLASTRSPKSGFIQLYLWRFPFLTFHELTSCRYHVPLHESEDNGITSAVLQSGNEGEDNLICITTWTQSGTPVLVQPRGGHQSAIKTESTKHGKVGNRIQCAAFSQSGQELAVVNDKGYLYQISHINSSPLDIKRLATSKELTAKSSSFSMGFMEMGDEDAIVMVWADSAKSLGWIKKIPITTSSRNSRATVVQTSGPVVDFPLRPDLRPIQPTSPPATSTTQVTKSAEIQPGPVGLPTERPVRELDNTELSPASDESKTPGRVPGFFEYKP